MRRWNAVAVLAVASLSTSAAASAQSTQRFDLHCDVVSTDGGEQMAGIEMFRIDLEASQFCLGSCDIVRDFREPPSASELNLTFEAIFRGERLGFDYVTRVNRVTGRISMRSERGDYSATGQCRREPFSSFPAAVF